MDHKLVDWHRCPSSTRKPEDQVTIFLDTDDVVFTQDVLSEPQAPHHRRHRVPRASTTTEMDTQTRVNGIFGNLLTHHGLPSHTHDCRERIEAPGNGRQLTFDSFGLGAAPLLQDDTLVNSSSVLLLIVQSSSQVVAVRMQCSRLAHQSGIVGLHLLLPFAQLLVHGPHVFPETASFGFQTLCLSPKSFSSALKRGIFMLSLGECRVNFFVEVTLEPGQRCILSSLYLVFQLCHTCIQGLNFRVGSMVQEMHGGEFQFALEVTRPQLLGSSPKSRDLLVSFPQELLHALQLVLERCPLCVAPLDACGEHKTMPTSMHLQASCGAGGGSRRH
mmetsp:Transcript_29744/g.79017  ORF Transcript_29744/g.79017 Transcript_29744/m.79017 type:complete len:331 (-) Transcript_29744:289-1281(-)